MSCLRAFRGQRYAETILSSAEACGVKPEVLVAEDLSRRFSCFRLSPNTEGIYEQTGAGHISPRRLVAAQSFLAKRNGAAIIAETVKEVRESGSRVSVATDSGETYTADQVMVAAGGFTIAEPLLPAKIDLTVFARTVAYFEIGEDEAAALSGMPSLIYKPVSAEDGIYLLPPIRYPDGRFYIKIGGDPDDLVLEAEKDVRAWFRTEGHGATREHLTRILCDLMPDIRVLNTTTATCVTSFSPSGYPMIGFSPSQRIAVLTAGCGAGAKSSDEIGRLGAVADEDGDACR